MIEQKARSAATYRRTRARVGAVQETYVTSAADDRHAAHRDRWRTENRERYLARMAVKKAVRMGRLVKPTHCQGCSEPKRRWELHGHHEHGYEGPNRYRVAWLCAKCHAPYHPRRRRAA